MSCPETAPDTLQLQHEDSLQRTANADPPHPQLSLPSVEGRRGQRELLNLRSRATVEHIKSSHIQNSGESSYWVQEGSVGNFQIEHTQLP